jgi:hypothetical protein
MSRRLSSKPVFPTPLNSRRFFHFQVFWNRPSSRPGPAVNPIVFPHAGQPMWYQKPAECPEDVETFRTKAGVR